MLWLILAIATSVVFMQTMRWSQHAQCNMAWVAFVNYCFAVACYLPLYKPPAEHGIVVTVLGAIVGVLFAVNFSLVVVVIRACGLGLTSATMTLATVVPVLVSIAGGDPWGDRTPGLVVAIVAAPMLILGRSATNGSSRSTLNGHGALRMLLLLTFIGTEMSLFKVASRLGGNGFERAFLPALFTAAMATSCIPAAIAGARSCGRGDVLRGLLMGVCNVSANYAFARALMEVSGVVVFPVRHIGGVVCGTGLGYILWRERVSRLGLAGIVLGLVAAVMLSIAGDAPPAPAPGP